MRFKGTLAKWNADRGFGFIRPMEPGPDVFVHASAFGRGEAPPKVGEALTYELTAGPDGRPRAVAVARSGAASRPARPRADRRPPRRESPLTGRLVRLGVIALGAVVGFGYQSFLRKEPAASDAATVGDVLEQLQAAPSRYACDGRTHCSQMGSCEEATWVLEHCPNTEMDGDGDGVPCERQWCR